MVVIVVRTILVDFLSIMKILLVMLMMMAKLNCGN